MSNDDKSAPEKGVWASVVDGLVGALTSALIAGAGAMVRDNLALRDKLDEAKDVLEKQREVERRRRSAEHVERVRRKWAKGSDEK